MHRSWRTTTKPGLVKPTKHAQVTELSITSWNPVTLNHGKLKRLLNYVGADIDFQSARLRLRTMQKDGKAKDDTITPVKSAVCSRRYQIFSWGWNSREFINHVLLWSADRQPRGNFRSWTDRTEVRSAERPHGGNQGKSQQTLSDLTR